MYLIILDLHTSCVRANPTGENYRFLQDWRDDQPLMRLHICLGIGLIFPIYFNKLFYLYLTEVFFPCQHAETWLFNFTCENQTLTWATCRGEDNSPIKYTMPNVSSESFEGNLCVITRSAKMHQPCIIKMNEVQFLQADLWSLKGFTYVLKLLELLQKVIIQLTTLIGPLCISCSCEEVLHCLYV